MRIGGRFWKFSLICCTLVNIFNFCGTAHASVPATLGERIVESVSADKKHSRKALEAALEKEISKYKLANKWREDSRLRAALLEWLTGLYEGASVEGVAQKLQTQRRHLPLHLLSVAEQFFPAHLYSLSNSLYANKQLKAHELGEFADSHDLWFLRPAAQMGTGQWETVLFDRSASLSLKNVPDFETGILRYRNGKTGSWQHALPVLPNPLQNSASTVLVGLNPNTQYDVQITLYKSGKAVLKEAIQIETQTNIPPTSSRNTYRFADLVKNGKVDLAALGIKGSAREWVKVVFEGKDAFHTQKNAPLVHIKNARYVHFEGLKIRGGEPHAVLIEDSHDIWINDCDIAGWGRKAMVYKEGKAYADKKASKPINYDAGIAIKRSGRVTVENCTIHSPRTGANTWEHGHPHGPTGILVDAAHNEHQYQGQIVIRHNTIKASHNKRFNDAIESRYNGSASGGFVRDSFIYNNAISYANDDLIELDGSQRNVAVFNNVFEHGLCAVSATPNRHGPSFVFSNRIHSLGDQRGRSYTALKLGGGLITPIGITYIADNVISVPRYVIGSVTYRGDRYFWAHFEDNHLQSEAKRSNKKPPRLFNFKGAKVDIEGLDLSKKDASGG